MATVDSKWLLIVYEVVREFEFTPLRQGVFRVQYSLSSRVKNAHLAGIRVGNGLTDAKSPENQWSFPALDDTKGRSLLGQADALH
jgi:hypothetical protein